ncbi:carboxyltransferase domain-containing protein [Bifidobacterium porcinum]|uniref:5-oxoprolinase subunit B/C family protein n=1 Tax=Bifidobacterium porcinum TaxID=212365 RepID=UPI00399537FB
MRRILTAGQDALLVETGDLRHALGLYHALNAAMEDAVSANASAGESVASPAPTRPLAAVTELVPAAQTVLVRFDPRKIRPASLAEAIMTLSDTPDEAQEHRTVTVPVIYDGEDLEAVAQLLGISADEVVARHTGTPWTAAFGGFAPGFTYLVDGNPIFDVPRRTTPRLVVPLGAVGLAGRFSGVYPRESSGGWQLIGHTAMPMWDVHADPPAAIMPGDRVTFHAERDQAIMTDIAQQRRTPTDRDIRANTGNSGSGSESTTCDHGLRADRPGLLALFEDEGRHASAMGVAGSGACDMPAYRLANMLVGNPPDAPAIELTAGDAAFTAIGNVVVAVTGAPVDLCITGKAASGADPGHKTIRQSLHRQEAIILHDGETLTIGVPRAGLRDYLAIRGGFKAPMTLGSASRDTMSGIGPAPLAAGDTLTAGTPDPSRSVGRPCEWNGHLPTGTMHHAGPQAIGGADHPVWLDVTLGPHDDWFTPAAIGTLFGTTWRVTAQSNRTGLRLNGPQPLEREDTRELPSEGMVPGSLEVPGSGQPVLFLRDQPVTGGYPVIAVLTLDALALAAQLPPGAFIRFRKAGESAMAASGGQDISHPDEHDGKESR